MTFGMPATLKGRRVNLSSASGMHCALGTLHGSDVHYSEVDCLLSRGKPYKTSCRVRACESVGVWSRYVAWKSVFAK